MIGKLFKKKDRYAKAWTYFEEGEVECAKCDGTGYDQSSPFWWLDKCRRCGGEGKTDWVTNIMGRDGEDYEVSCSSTWSSSVSKTSTSQSNTYLRRIK